MWLLQGDLLVRTVMDNWVMAKTTLRLLSLTILATCFATANATVVINEFLADDSGTDDREFVELYNGGSASVDISGWAVGGRDTGATLNPSATIPGALNSGTTMLLPGGYYVLGNTGTLNANQVVAANFVENDNETLELWQGPVGTSTLVDAVAVETNKGTAWAASPPSNLNSQLGPGYFGNHQGVDVVATPLNATVSIGRFVNGRDSNNNGRDFGLRPSTPGTTNAPGGVMTEYVVPDATLQANGSNISNMTGSFVTPRVIDPTVADTNNPNVIPAPAPGHKAFVSWDPSGGGNGSTTNAVFDTTQAAFSLYAYLDTNDLPIQSNAVPTPFRGSEITMYGLGSGDAFTNLTDLTGDIGLAPATLPLTESANGFTGLVWVYEKVGIPVGGGAVSEKLHLVDANDGGDSDLAGNTPLDWTIIQSFDLSTTASGWYQLSISVDPVGNVVAKYGANVINTTTSTSFNGAAFNVGYRENLQIGADGTPDAIMRPATFSAIPEPAAFLFGGVASAIAGMIAYRRRKAA